MGMTLTASNALLAGSATVLNAKLPEFGKLVAVRDWKGLDNVFRDVTKRAINLALVGAVLGTAFIWTLQSYSSLGKRFIPAPQAAMLFSTVVFQLLIGAFAGYLRAHKQEPLMRMTIISSALQCAATWYLGKKYASFGVTAGYFGVTTLFMLPYCYQVWRHCRKEWHSINQSETIV
jgi:O-antigen/teichoic acid export membrane protein